jgi:hypothetical protein
VAGVVQRIHNLLGTKRAAYSQPPLDASAEPEAFAAFSRRTKPTPPNLRAAPGAPLVAVGFGSLPGFAAASAPPTLPAARPFSGGGAPLKGLAARPPCELCGGTDYRSRGPVADR